MAELYILTPPRIEPGFETTLDAALSAGPVGALQIRLKDHSREDLLKLAPPLIKTAHRHGVAVILNDDPQLALDLGCDGVHIGQEDAPYSVARKTVGPARIVGVTCHDSRHLAMEAGEKGADYVAFGAFHLTATKTPKSSADIALIEWWSQLFEIPCVAIGGITVDNAAPLIAAGADYLAVSGGIWKHEGGPASAVKAFAQLLKVR